MTFDYNETTDKLVVTTDDGRVLKYVFVEGTIGKLFELILMKLESSGVTPNISTWALSENEEPIPVEKIVISTANLTDGEKVALKEEIESWATVGNDEIIPASKLPSFVDDVVEVATYSDLEAITGEAGKIYIVTDTGKCYRWSGSQYVVIEAGGVVIGTTTGTALDGKIGTDHINNVDIHVTKDEKDKWTEAYSEVASNLSTVGESVQLGTADKDLNLNTRDNKVMINSYGEVVYSTPYPGDETGRRAIQLKNNDTISSMKVDGSGIPLIFASKWDKVEVGSPQALTNINTSDVVTINDEKVVATTDQLPIKVSLPIRNKEDKIYPQEEVLGWFGCEDLAGLGAMITSGRQFYLSYGAYYAIPLQFVNVSDNVLEIITDGLDTSDDTFSRYHVTINLDGEVIEGQSNVKIEIQAHALVTPEEMGEFAKKSEIPTSLKNPEALTINVNGTEVSYDGSTPQSVTVDIKQNNIPLGTLTAGKIVKTGTSGLVEAVGGTDYVDITTLTSTIKETRNEVTKEIGVATTNMATLSDIPTTLPSPSSLDVEFNGVPIAEYDGSEGVRANITIHQEDLPSETLPEGSLLKSTPSGMVAAVANTDYVAITRKVGGKPLSGDIILASADLSDYSEIARKSEIPTDYVPITRLVNGKPLSGDVALSSKDLSDGADLAKASDTVPSSITVAGHALTANVVLQLSDLTDAGTVALKTEIPTDYVPDVRKVANKPLTSDITISSADLTDGTDLVKRVELPENYVPTTREVAGHPLSGDITLSSSDLTDGEQLALKGELPTDYVVNTRTVAGKALNQDIALASTDLTDSDDLARISNLPTDYVQKQSIATLDTSADLTDVINKINEIIAGLNQ